MRKILSGETVIALDVSGTMYGSKDFSGFLQDLVGRGLNQLVFYYRRAVGSQQECD